MNLELFIISFILIGSLWILILSKNTIHIIFWFVLIYLNGATLLFIFSFYYLPLVLIIVYIGAITILFLFIIMMLDILHQNSLKSEISFIFVTLFSLYNLYVGLSSQKIINNVHIKENLDWQLELSPLIHVLGFNLYTDWFIYFFLVTIILIIGLIATVVLCIPKNTLNM